MVRTGWEAVCFCFYPNYFTTEEFFSKSWFLTELQLLETSWQLGISRKNWNLCLRAPSHLLSNQFIKIASYLRVPRLKLYSFAYLKSPEPPPPQLGFNQLDSTLEIFRPGCVLCWRTAPVQVSHEHVVSACDKQVHPKPYKLQVLESLSLCGAWS